MIGTLEDRLRLGLIVSVSEASIRSEVSIRQFWRWIAAKLVPVERHDVGGYPRTFVPVACLPFAPIPQPRGRRSAKYGQRA